MMGWEREEEEGGARIFDVARADACLVANFRVWPVSLPFDYLAE